jgi:hypothetical protein
LLNSATLVAIRKELRAPLQQHGPAYSACEALADRLGLLVREHGHEASQ